MITDTPKESLDVANIEYDLPCEDDLFESNPTKLNVVFSPPIDFLGSRVGPFINMRCWLLEAG